MSYWLYQHLGNLSPEVIRSEGILAGLGQVEDGLELLRAWAMKSEEFTPVAGGYRFTFHRDIGRVRLVMIDDRNARVLTRNARQMVDDDEWKWVVDSCHADVDHLLIGSSLPVFVPGGLHDLQVLSEALCDGAWGWPGRKFGEWARRKADMEDWPAFVRSFDAFVELLRELAASSRSHAPATIAILSGDIHFSYASEIRFIDGHTTGSRIHQLVSSPIRNALKPPESTAMRLGTSRVALHVSRLLRRAARRRREVVEWKIDGGPVFGNSLGQLVFDGRAARLSYFKTRPHDEQRRPTLDLAIEVELVTVPEGGGG